MLALVGGQLRLPARRRRGVPGAARRAARRRRAGRGAGARGGRAGPGAAARQRAGQKELVRLERQISRLAGTEAALSEQLAASATDYEKLVELGAELKAAQEERAALEERWLELAEELAD